ncbi:AP-3 complex subunit beta-2 [Actinomortierella wolfii]|nr:AP-3 complex subunit beta-2 [Actinomortierella wolfii]
MISKGRDVSEFFPDVVKNVASNSLEVRKLVYIYILRYAEQEQDLTLLSINTFQKDLGDKNQLIRAMALRVMSGIRVPVISPIVMLGIKKCVTDLSPYVRKIAAHAIPKLYQLDPSQKDALIDVITKLLSDNSTFTIGSVLMAFNEVCPDRYDLIHPHYHKLCRMLVDMDEWGQITAMDLLLHYARTQFLNPIGKSLSGSATKPKPKKEKSVARSFYSDDDSDISHHSSEESESSEEDLGAYMDPDLAFLLKCAQPLLQSRNSQVVLSVAKLYNHLAPAAESLKLARPLVRLLRGHREIQYVVLNNILAIASHRAYIFDQHYQPFFVRATDPVFIQNLKLDILTLIATETNITFILRELQEYVKSPNKEFATKAIKAIGRCAVNIPEMAEGCLGGLLKLAHSNNDSIVAEAVVAIRNLIQERSQDDTALIAQLTKSLDQIKEPNARANVFWLVGQYCSRLPTIAPDVLRQGAKSFTSENDNGKLQILTLGGKLIASKEIEPRNTINVLFQYVLNLARYDLSYDVRDRARFLRFLIYGDQKAVFSHVNGQEEAGYDDHSEQQDGHENSHDEHNDEGGFEYSDKDVDLSDHVRSILLSEKQPPVHENPSNGRENFTMGSMSLVLNRAIAGYEPLPDWPTVQPDPTIRRSASGLDTPGHMNDRRGFGSDSPRIGGFSSSSSPAFSRSSSTVGSRSNTFQAQSLDKFLDSSEEEETDTSSESESSGDEDATSSEGEETSEEEDDEDEDEDEDDEEEEEETSEEETSDEE